LTIPIKNLYFLLVYAWDVLDEVSTADVGAEDVDVPSDLFAQLLRSGVDHLVKRGLDRGYQSDIDEIRGVRGKIRISETMRRGLVKSGRLVCEFDELTHDVLHNRILKATMLHLLRVEGLNPKLRTDLRDRIGYFSDVADIELTNVAFARVQLHSNMRFYRVLLQICALLFRQLLPDTSGNRFRFVEFSEEQLEHVFEGFVRNYLRRNQNAFHVSYKLFHWDPISGSDDDLDFLPRMETDVSLESADRQIVIECKYNKSSLVQSYRGDQQKIRPAHLYQLFAYLTNLSRRDTR
jgi:5-methylcytosine-specific restriction enzyme subunit McrC